MNILICGAGEVGRYAAEVLGRSANSITVLDRNPEKLAMLEDSMDIRSIVGNGTQADVLLEAGCDQMDVFLAATNIDEINLLSASVAKGVGARRCIARVHHSAFFDKRGLDYGELLGIDHLVCPEYATAVAIAQSLRSPGALAVERFAHGRIEVQQLPVADDAVAVGSTLESLGMPSSTRIGSIERNRIPFIPDRLTRIETGDVVTIIGDVDQLDKARKLFHAASEHRARIVILGGTSLGVWLCRSLHSRSFSVRLIEPNRERATELAEKLDWVTILRADVIDSDILEQERVDQADAFVALTADDEHNILAAARARGLGTPNVIAVVQRPTYLNLIEQVGINRAFSPRVTAVNEIQHLLDESPIKHMATLAAGIAEIFEVCAPANAPLLDKPLKDVKFPAHTMVAAVQRGDEVHVPGAMTTIQAGDRVIVIGPSESRKDLRRFFAIS